MSRCSHARDTDPDVRVVGGAIVQIIRRPTECRVLVTTNDRAPIVLKMVDAGGGATTTSCTFSDQSKCPWSQRC